MTCCEDSSPETGNSSIFRKVDFSGELSNVLSGKGRELCPVVISEFVVSEFVVLSESLVIFSSSSECVVHKDSLDLLFWPFLTFWPFLPLWTFLPFWPCSTKFSTDLSTGTTVLAGELLLLLQMLVKLWLFKDVSTRRWREEGESAGICCDESTCLSEEFELALESNTGWFFKNVRFKGRPAQGLGQFGTFHFGPVANVLPEKVSNWPSFGKCSFQIPTVNFKNPYF